MLEYSASRARIRARKITTCMGLQNPLAEAFETRHPVALEVCRHQHVMGATDQQSARNETDVPRITAVVPIVAQEEVAVRGHADWTETAPRRKLRQELNLAPAAIDGLAGLQGQGGTCVVPGLTIGLEIRIFRRHTVDIELVVPQLDHIARHADQAL